MTLLAGSESVALEHKTTCHYGHQKSCISPTPVTSTKEDGSLLQLTTCRPPPSTVSRPIESQICQPARCQVVPVSREGHFTLVTSPGRNRPNKWEKAFKLLLYQLDLVQITETGWHLALLTLRGKACRIHRVTHTQTLPVSKRIKDDKVGIIGKIMKLRTFLFLVRLIQVFA